MQYERLPGIALILCSVLIASISQLMLKKSADYSHGSRLAEYWNPLVIGGYGLLLCSTLINICALHWIPLLYTAAFDSAGQIFVPLLSHIILKEKINRRKCFSILIIIFGMCVFLL